MHSFHTLCCQIVFALHFRNWSSCQILQSWLPIKQKKTWSLKRRRVLTPFGSQTAAVCLSVKMIVRIDNVWKNNLQHVNRLRFPVAKNSEKIHHHSDRTEDVSVSVQHQHSLLCVFSNLWPHEPTAINRIWIRCKQVLSTVRSSVKEHYHKDQTQIGF